MSNRVSLQKKQTATPTLTLAHGSLLQRKCACGTHTIAGGECGSCLKEKSSLMLQRAATSAEHVNEVPPVVHEVLSSPGQSLDAATRSFFEPRFSQNFSHVRVHTDSKAAESAHSVSALAYTVGRDVVFGAGQYAPETVKGAELLAHELTHVAQQRSTASISPARVALDTDNGEVEAESVARHIISGRKPVGVNGSSALGSLQRQTASPQADDPKDKTKDEKKVVTQPTSQKVPAAQVKEAEKKQTDEESKPELAASVGVETETKKEDGKTTTEAAGKFKIEATFPITDKLQLGPISFFKEMSGAMGGKLNLSQLEWEESLKMISIEFPKAQGRLGLLESGVSGSAIFSGEQNFKENKNTAHFGFGAGLEAKYKRSEKSPFFITVEGGVEKTYDREGNADFKWGPLTWKTSVSVGYTFPR